MTDKSGRRCFVAGHRGLLPAVADRIAENHAFDGVLLGKFPDAPEIVIHSRALEGGQPLGGDPEPVRHRQANAPGAEIDSQNPRPQGGLLRYLSYTRPRHERGKQTAAESPGSTYTRRRKQLCILDRVRT